MKIIIAGSRDIFSTQAATKLTSMVEELKVLIAPETISVVFSGVAEGVDYLGEKWAEKEGLPVQLFHADWNGLGKRAGHERNKDMVTSADALICLHNGSRGSADVIRQACAKGIPVVQYNCENETWKNLVQEKRKNLG